MWQTATSRWLTNVTAPLQRQLVFTAPRIAETSHRAGGVGEAPTPPPVLSPLIDVGIFV